MLTFHDKSSGTSAAGSHVRAASVILIVSEAAQVEGAPFDVLGIDLPLVRPFLTEALGRAAPSKDAHGSFECLVPGEGGALRRLVVAILPTACSRNNSPAMPHAVAAVVRAHKGKGPLAVCLLSAPEHALPQALAVARCFPTYSKTSAARKAALEGKAQDPVDVFLSMPQATALGVTAPVLDSLASDIRLAQHLVDMPPADMNCSFYVAQCEATAAELAPLGVSIRVIRGEALRDMGCGGIWGVGMASEHPPALVVLSHTPSDAAARDSKSVCLVGKGIVFDTGGLSIKVPPGMNGMKDDMAGSAACLGSFRSIVQAGGLSRPLHAVLCIAENSIDSRAFRPDDVLTMLSGKSVEINNTDAEGRLVLADGVSYSANTLNAGLIVDIATLTGAQLITTGKKHAAVYCSSLELEAAAVAAGMATGDLTFPMLYAPEFHRLEFKSAVADMKNSVSDRMNAQCSCAAAFIGSHIDEYLERGGQWVHVDMAGPAMVGDRASGYGVGLLFAMARSWRG